MHKKNDGMSLIEVIVSMLVLSIAVVAVTMSFSMVAKINVGSKQKQSVEALMENLLEYAEAGGTEYQSWFHVPAEKYTVSDDGVKKIETLEGVGQGLFQYNVVVTTDRAPEEYEKAKLNDFGVIQFGGTGSNTILIDASLKGNDDELHPNNINDYDETAFEYFYILHSGAVTQHNLIEEQKKLENPLYPADPWTEIPEAAIPNYIDRELRLIVTTPTEGKMQLEAYFTYILKNSVKLPGDEEDEEETEVVKETHLYEIPLYVSELYDKADSTDPDAKKLNQIYIMYSPAGWEVAGFGYGKDIRLWDAEAETSKALHASIYIANQKEGSDPTAVDTAIGLTGLGDRLGVGNEIKLSFLDPEESKNKAPKGATIYCSGSVVMEGNSSAVEYKGANTLVATGEEVRIVTTTLEIKNPTSNETLAKKTITLLQ